MLVSAVSRYLTSAALPFFGSSPMLDDLGAAAESFYTHDVVSVHTLRAHVFDATLSLPPVPHAEGPAGLVSMTQGVADAFTSALRAHPEDWHMMQKVFVEDLARAR